MEKISGYAIVLSSARIRQDALKPVFGRPSIKYGQCLQMAAYFIQLGSVLGERHRHNPDAFAHAFLGATGEPGSMARFVKMSISDTQSQVSQHASFIEYVQAEQANRLNVVGGSTQLLVTMGMQKIDLETAISMMHQFAMSGAILGIGAPAVARALFEQSNLQVDQIEWTRARSVGLNIPMHQDAVSWNDVQNDEDTAFRAYCEQCAPTLYRTLFG